MGLDRANVTHAMEAMLAVVPDAQFRLVGTASCVLRGIDLQASDIDVLFRERESIDAWATSLRDFADVTDAPTWLEDRSQYFASLDANGVTIELSTVELDIVSDTVECVGSGPWVHFDVVPCGEYSVPTVALELRLLTEVARERRDRWEPIAAYFRSHPCDVSLVKRGLAASLMASEDIEALCASFSVA